MEAIDYLRKKYELHPDETIGQSIGMLHVSDVVKLMEEYAAVKQAKKFYIGCEVITTGSHPWTGYKGVICGEDTIDGIHRWRIKLPSGLIIAAKEENLKSA